MWRGWGGQGCLLFRSTAALLPLPCRLLSVALTYLQLVLLIRFAKLLTHYALTTPFAPSSLSQTLIMALDLANTFVSLVSDPPSTFCDDRNYVILYCSSFLEAPVELWLVGPRN